MNYTKINFEKLLANYQAREKLSIDYLVREKRIQFMVGITVINLIVLLIIIIFKII